MKINLIVYVFTNIIMILRKEKRMLEVKNLRKTFKLSNKQQKIERTKEKIKVAVSDVSFKADNGQILGILGANGAGKTTTLRMLATVIKPEDGQILFNGEDIYSDIDGYRAKIGFLTSELKLEDFFTPDYLYDYFSQLYGIDKDTAAQRKKELFEKFGIDKFAGVKVADLSTGMKQKISLVISIVNDPDIIIFDEPTNGLDIITERIVVNFLLELKQQGKCIIISSHIFDLIEKICDRVAIIIDGRTVKCDTLENVMGERSLEDCFFTIYQEEGGDINA